MANITKDTLWRLHELVQKKCQAMTRYQVNTMDGTVSLAGTSGVFANFSIDAAIDYLDPPALPMSEEWREAWGKFCTSHDMDRMWRNFRDLAERHDRAKASQREPRRDKRSMFDLRGEE